MRPQPRRSSTYVGFRRGLYGRNHTAVAVPANAPASTRLPNNLNVCRVDHDGPSFAIPEPDFPEIMCSAGQSSGGQGEESFVVVLGSTAGTVTLDYDAYSVPDRFRVSYNGVTVIDTGLVGDSGNYDGEDVVTAGPGSGSASFFKPADGPTFAVVTVNAPYSGTAWEFNLGCPV
jgi:hypothetical protein